MKKTPLVLKSVGITLSYSHRGWIARIDYSTMQHALPECIEGSVGPRYHSPSLAKSIDLALAAAVQIGVHWLPEPYLHVEGEGDDPAILLPPNWRKLVWVESERLGWKSNYPLPTAIGRGKATCA